jgi:hypothetical protein
MIVAGGGDGLLWFWEAASARPLWTLPAHNPYVVGIHYDGDDVITRGFGGDMSRWTLPKSRPLIEACEPGKPCVTLSR